MQLIVLILQVTVAYKRKCEELMNKGCEELMNKGLDEEEIGEGKRAETL